MAECLCQGPSIRESCHPAASRPSCAVNRFSIRRAACSISRQTDGSRSSQTCIRRKRHPRYCRACHSHQGQEELRPSHFANFSFRFAAQNAFVLCDAAFFSAADIGGRPLRFLWHGRGSCWRGGHRRPPAPFRASSQRLYGAVELVPLLNQHRHDMFRRHLDR